METFQVGDRVVLPQVSLTLQWQVQKVAGNLCKVCPVDPCLERPEHLVLLKDGNPVDYRAWLVSANAVADRGPDSRSDGAVMVDVATPSGL